MTNVKSQMAVSCWAAVLQEVSVSSVMTYLFVLHSTFQDGLKVVYAYDRCLTCSREVDAIWQHQRISLAVALYVLIHISVMVYLCTTVILLIATSCKVRHTSTASLEFSTLTVHVTEVVSQLFLAIVNLPLLQCLRSLCPGGMLNGTLSYC